MNVKLCIVLTEIYSKCPYCKNPYVGNGQGALLIDDKEFKRSCKCGFEVTVTIKEKLREEQK